MKNHPLYAKILPRGTGSTRRATLRDYINGDQSARSGTVIPAQTTKSSLYDSNGRHTISTRKRTLDLLTRANHTEHELLKNV
jgi:hypothetical protein